MSGIISKEYRLVNLKNIKKYTPGFNIHDIQKKYKLKKVIKLASNENPFISKDVLSFIKKSNHKLNLYPDSNPDELHKLLADTVGHRMTRNNIILGNGSNEILEFIVRANIDNKSEVIIPKHSFLVYEIISKLQNAKIITTKPDNDKSSENYLGINLESVIEKITKKTKLIFIANPANPTGTYISLSEINNFLQLVPKNTSVIIDEAYYEYLNPNINKTAVSLINKYKNLYVTRSFSKIYGLASLRVGYGISSQDNISLLKNYKQPFNSNLFAQKAALLALKDFKFTRESKENNDIARIKLTELFNRLSIDYLGTYCNFITFRAGKRSKQLFEYLLKKGVIVRPLANYGLTDYLRVSLGTPHDNNIFIKHMKLFYSDKI
jgi:histidinol-phosphate aminotransferase